MVTNHFTRRIALLGDDRHAVDVEHRRPTAHAHGAGGRGTEEHRQLVVAAGGEPCRHEVVTGTSGGEHHAILPVPGPDAAADAGEPSAVARVAAVTVTARQVAERIGAHVGVPPRPTTVDGFLAGDPDAPITGVAVTMMATFDVLQRAAARGLDLVVTHEPLYFHHHGTADAALAADADPVHAAKAAFVAEHGLVVLHLHDAWHDRRPDGILTGTARALGWLDAERPDLPGVYDLPPTTLGALAAHVAQALGARALRYVGDPDTSVSAVGLQPGFHGFDLNRRLLARPDVDVVVIGEGHEWETGEYAADAVTAGVCAGVVVVGHVPSEQEGMAEAGRWLADLVPEVPVELVAAVDPFRTVGVQGASTRP